MKIITSELIAINAKIAIIVSQFNRDITDKLTEGALSVLKRYIDQKDITIMYVPGAIEIPLAVQRFARTNQFDGIIALGAVIFGQTDHYHHVCHQVSHGCQQVMLDESLPVIFGVLTVRSMQQALDRSGGHAGHMGVEAAEAALKMIAGIRQI